jgi:hypothetical protein
MVGLISSYRILRLLNMNNLSIGARFRWAFGIVIALMLIESLFAALHSPVRARLFIRAYRSFDCLDPIPRMAAYTVVSAKARTSQFEPVR